MKILAVIDNDLYFRNFIKSGAFDELLKKNNFKISKATQVISKDPRIPKNKFILPYKRSEENKETVFIWNKIAMRTLRKKSSTFDIKTIIYKHDLKSEIMFRIFSSPLIFNFTKKIFIYKLKPNPSLEKIIKIYKPNLVILPLTGTEGTSYELIALSKKYSFETFFLVNGWDNLSSKAVFLLKPDFLGVWGPQQFNDAVKIQGMAPKRCFLIGCARYEDYFKTHEYKKKPFPFKYILFAGTQTAHDEITPLRLLDKTVSKLRIKNVKIIYRPHPNREKRSGDDFFQASDYKNIVLDPQIANDYYNNKEKGLESALSQNFPELDYNTELMKNALFIISPLSSLILEAAIFDVPSLIPATEHDPNPMSPANHLKWHHFKGAKDIPGWFIANTDTELSKLFRQMVKRFYADNPNHRTYKGVLSQAIKKYLYHDNLSYSQRLKKVVNILNKLYDYH